MRKVKEREAQKEKVNSEKTAPVKGLWKSDKYKDVQSKIKDLLLVNINYFFKRFTSWYSSKMFIIFLGAAFNASYRAKKLPKSSFTHGQSYSTSSVG